MQIYSYTYMIQNRYKILTPNGFEDFDGVQKITHTGYVLVKLSNGVEIKCSKNHAFILDDREIFAHELYEGCEIDTTTSESVYVISISYINEIIDLFDILNVDSHKFIVNGLVSHNCDADFISSGNTLLEPDLLSWYENTTVQEPVEKRGFDGNLWIWEYPNYSRQYVVSADVARGDGGDYSAFHIIDVETLTQVAEYKGQIGTKEFGHMLMSVATEYNKALLVVENANVGWAALQPIIESGYENLFYAANDLSIMDIQAQIAKGYDLKDKYNMKPGFSTTSRTRPLLISKLDTVARERCIIIRSKRLMSELRVFIWKGDRAEAQSGYNDDLVMSFCIGIWVRDTAFKLIQQGLDLTKRALGHIHKSGETSIYSPGIVRQTGWSMSNGKGSEESLTWLI